MCRRAVSFAAEFGIIRLVFLEHVVDGGQQHSGDGDNRFLVASALFQILITVKDFRVFLLRFNGGKGTLYKQRLDVGPSAADSGSFFLPGTLIVLRRKPSPGAKMLRGGKHGHIHANFRDNANGGKGLDTRSRCNEVNQVGGQAVLGRQ